ncbi:hypothetical protein K2173_025408 [Erythroxylum novogranatense]|uniref:Mechanosensitive ion channel MscS domain-containing protein n=1 Tax=Erythroxylum novogranatense TaxID=1862640 RepID=A0AAV8UGL9_9ROSI|nr:hypothetical protein K2173_025408 [Erythroxylum novogranatense]
MVRVGFQILKSLYCSINPCLKLKSFQPYNSYSKFSGLAGRNAVRSSFLNHILNVEERTLARNSANSQLQSFSCGVSPGCTYYYKNTKLYTAFASTSSKLYFQNAVPCISVSPILGHRPFSWSSGGKPQKSEGLETSAAPNGANVNVGDGGAVGSDWTDKVKDAWQSAVDAVNFSGEKVKEASDEVTPYVNQFLDSHPYLKEVVVPVGYTLTGTLLAWVVMPRLLRRFHKYAMQTPAALLSRSMSVEQVPYEKSFWGALEDPVRYLITFMAFTQIAMMVAPTTVASQYITQAWRGAIIISFVWFLHRAKTNVLSRLLTNHSLVGLDREKIVTLDRLSSVGLFVIGLMALAEACGVAVQSILTVGGIGGVATAFAAREVLGNVLSGLSMQFSKPFSLGDRIKAGSIEGQVVEMGLTTTSLLNAEKFPVLVPNSLFSSQVIVNKSRAQCHTMVAKIPLTVDDLDKIPHISNDIANMLKLNPKVFLETEAPYCFLSRVESSFAEMTLGFNLKHMKKEELYSTQQDILLQAVEIVKKHGVALGKTWS